MSEGLTFEAYLGSKKIDSEAFRKAEPELWNAWKSEFGQMHANSFTVQKLNLINPIRRKYQLATPDEPRTAKVAEPPKSPVSAPAVPRPGKPVMKPKMN
jgi:hypothetical protein